MIALRCLAVLCSGDLKQVLAVVAVLDADETVRAPW